MELSFFEIILVGIIAFLVLGPTEMVRLSHKLGTWVGKLKTEGRNFRILAEEQLLKAEKKTEIPELKKIRDLVSGGSEALYQTMGAVEAPLNVERSAAAYPVAEDTVKIGTATVVEAASEIATTAVVEDVSRIATSEIVEDASKITVVKDQGALSNQESPSNDTEDPLIADRNLTAYSVPLDQVELNDETTESEKLLVPLPKRERDGLL